VWSFAYCKITMVMTFVKFIRVKSPSIRFMFSDIGILNWGIALLISHLGDSLCLPCSGQWSMNKRERWEGSYKMESQDSSERCNCSVVFISDRLLNALNKHLHTSRLHGPISVRLPLPVSWGCPTESHKLDGFK
jgi:hypothetical protein